MLPLLGAALPALGSVIGGLIGSHGQHEANEATAAMAREQMDFQKEMSSTAYQRATQDMKAAGLNPMLAYMQGGASSPQGAMATMQNEGAGIGASVESGISSAMAGLQLRKQLSLLDAQKEKTVQEAGSAYWQRRDWQDRVGTGPGGRSATGDPFSWNMAQRRADLLMTQAQATSAKNLSRIGQRDADQETSTFGRGLNWMRRFRESMFGGGNAASAAGQAAGAARIIQAIP
ncbi:MAG: DNA pilot protein [Microvirus sp.]|nr:MAG: DNA pilot protein [Microvirus sp.]